MNINGPRPSAPIIRRPPRSRARAPAPGPRNPATQVSLGPRFPTPETYREPRQWSSSPRSTYYDSFCSRHEPYFPRGAFSYTQKPPSWCLRCAELRPARPAFAIQDDLQHPDEANSGAEVITYQSICGLPDGFSRKSSSSKVEKETRVLIKPIPLKKTSDGTTVEVYDYTLPKSLDEGDLHDQEVTRILSKEVSPSACVPTTMNVYFQSLWMMQEKKENPETILKDECYLDLPRRSLRLSLNGENK